MNTNLRGVIAAPIFYVLFMALLVTSNAKSQTKKNVDDAIQASADAAAAAVDAAGYSVNENRWKLVLVDSKEKIYLDTKSIERVGNDVSVWERTNYAEARLFNGQKKYTERISRTTYHCGSRRYSLGESIIRDSKGEMVYSFGAIEGQREAVIPDTKGEELYEAACS